VIFADKPVAALGNVGYIITKAAN